MNAAARVRGVAAATLWVWIASVSAARAQEAPLPQLLYSGQVTSLVYKRAGDTALELDLYTPQHGLKRPAPVHVFVHGGGWLAGSRRVATSLIHLPVFEYLGARGVVGVSIDYRLIGKPIGTRLEDAITDVRDALQFLQREHSTLGIDPRRLVIWGGSAGGQLALMAALMPVSNARLMPPIRAAAAWYAPADLTMFANSASGRQILTQVLGASLDAAPERYQKLSPIAWITATSPPLLIMTGDNDETVPPDVAMAMYRSAIAVGARAEYLQVRHAGHQWRTGAAPSDPSLAEVQRRTAAFLFDALQMSRRP